MTPLPNGAYVMPMQNSLEAMSTIELWLATRFTARVPSTIINRGTP